MPGAPVLVVTADADVARWVVAGGHGVVADPGAGLDAAVAAGVDAARGLGAGAVAIVLGDHPALRPREVRAALAAAGAHPASVAA